MPTTSIAFTIPTRLNVACMLFVSCLIAYVNRVNLSVNILAMVRQNGVAVHYQNHNNNNGSDGSTAALIDGSGNNDSDVRLVPNVSDRLILFKYYVCFLTFFVFKFFEWF